LIKNSIWKVALVLIVIASVMISATGVLAADSLTLSISADKSSAQPGDTATYTYTITNNSTDNITGLSLIDDKLGLITLPATEILAGENITATGSYTFAAADLPGPFTNSANVTGMLPSGDNVTASASASVELVENNSVIEIKKTADKASAVPGDNITYTYEIFNTGNTKLKDLTLNDDKLGGIALSSNTLAAGENMTATAMYTVLIADLPGPLTNTAIITAYDQLEEMVTANATASVKLEEKNSAIEIKKTADKASAVPGDNITYTYEIFNTGNTKLKDLTLNDDKLGGIALSSNTLAAGENMTVTAMYTVVVADLPGPLTNTATVSAYDESGEMITATSKEVSIKLTQKQERYTKREILQKRGVPGKGIDHAPGLQKYFNFKSQAEEHAGKKNINNNGKPKNK